jgi:hypothetical protein
MDFAGSREQDIAPVSAFYWAHQARTLADRVLATTDLLGIRVNVNVDGRCGSQFLAPDEMLLYRSGPPSPGSTDVCVNRAYADTIHHEYGHAIDYSLGGPLNRAYSEGFGDALAILVTRSNCYGRDGLGAGKCVRLADNAHVWPGSYSDPHDEGMIYSGFVWQLVQELKRTMTDDQAYDLAKALVLRSAGRNPLGIQNAVDLTLDVDDTDNNRANGTPHLPAIRAAAQRKKLWKPEWDPRP